MAWSDTISTYAVPNIQAPLLVNQDILPILTTLLLSCSIIYSRNSVSYSHAVKGSYLLVCLLLGVSVCRYLRVVQLTLLGSMISNLLLVMGSAFVAGGFYHPMQHFNQQGIQVNTGLLILSGQWRRV